MVGQLGVLLYSKAWNNDWGLHIGKRYSDLGVANVFLGG
jgi:hypothetical protein